MNAETPTYDTASPFTIAIDRNRIAELLSCAFDGGVGMWCYIENVHVPADADRSWMEKPSFWDPESVRQEYVAPLLGGHVEICERDPDGNDTMHKLDSAAISRGLALMITKKYNRHLGNFLGEVNCDASTGSVFLQLCIFGEVVF